LAFGGSTISENKGLYIQYQIHHFMKFLFIGKKLGWCMESHRQFMIKLHRFLFFFMQ